MMGIYYHTWDMMGIHYAVTFPLVLKLISRFLVICSREISQLMMYTHFFLEITVFCRSPDTASLVCVKK